MAAVKIRIVTVQNGAELGALGDEYSKSPYREWSPRLLKDKTHLLTSPSGIVSRVLRISVHMRDSLLDSRGCSRKVSFVFEQSRSHSSLHGDLLYSSPGAPSSAPF